MYKKLIPLGITEFKNVKYTFKPKNIDLWGGEEEGETTVVISAIEFEGGYKSLSIDTAINDVDITSFSTGFKDDSLFEKTKINTRIGKHHFHSIELMHVDGFSEEDSFFYTTEFNDSVAVLKDLLNIFGELELDSVEAEDMSNVKYVPFRAINLLKEHLNSKFLGNFSSREDVYKEVISFMEDQGEDFRSDLLEDSRSFLPKDFWGDTGLQNLGVQDNIEEFIIDHFDGDDDMFLDELM